MNRKPIRPPFRILLITSGEEYREDLIERVSRLATIPLGVMLRDAEHDSDRTRVMVNRTRSLKISPLITIVVNSPGADLVLEEGWWVHTPKALPASIRELRPYGCSAHTEIDLMNAESSGASYALLSPIYRTGSKPGQDPLGRIRFREMVKKRTIPVFALGGIDSPERAQEALQAGAWGVAGISLGTESNASRLKDIIELMSRAFESDDRG